MSVEKWQDSRGKDHTRNQEIYIIYEQEQDGTIEPLPRHDDSLFENRPLIVQKKKKKHYTASYQTHHLKYFIPSHPGLNLGISFVVLATQNGELVTHAGVE